MTQNWLKNAVFYQVYPTSFYDADGDGTGDLRGVLEKLDYIRDLGANAIWINPFYPSPFQDGGYDISDYRAVHETLGTMEDFEALVAGCKARGIRLILDLVIGHTSFRHPWFVESAKDETNRFSDWYIWTDNNFNKYRDRTIHGLFPRDGGYYINYYGCQPALNYGFNRIPETDVRKNAYDLGENWKMHYTDERLRPLREEILNIMRFWLNKGVDGFRVDLANSLVKECVFNSDRDEDIEGLRWLWNILIGTIKSEYPDAAFIAEWVYPANSVGKCGFDVDYLAHDYPVYNDLFRNEPGTNILPAFERGKNYFSPEGNGSVSDFLKDTGNLFSLLRGKGYFSVPSGYHDIVRLATKKDEATLKVIFAFLLTYKHVPFLYYGDEIGMTHRFGINKDGGYIRTGARTPMQWDQSEHRGFSKAKEVYLPTNDDPRQSVAAQEQDPSSLLQTVRKLTALRARFSCLNADGDLSVVSCENGGYPLVYRRSDANGSVLVFLQPKKQTTVFPFSGEVLLSFGGTQSGKKLNFDGPGFAIIRE